MSHKLCSAVSSIKGLSDSRWKSRTSNNWTVGGSIPAPSSSYYLGMGNINIVLFDTIPLVNGTFSLMRTIWPLR